MNAQQHRFAGEFSPGNGSFNQLETDHVYREEGSVAYCNPPVRENTESANFEIQSTLSDSLEKFLDDIQSHSSGSASSSPVIENTPLSTPGINQSDVRVANSSLGYSFHPMMPTINQGGRPHPSLGSGEVFTGIHNGSLPESSQNTNGQYRLQGDGNSFLSTTLQPLNGIKPPQQMDNTSHQSSFQTHTATYGNVQIPQNQIPSFSNNPSNVSLFQPPFTQHNLTTPSSNEQPYSPLSLQSLMSRSDSGIVQSPLNLQNLTGRSEISSHSPITLQGLTYRSESDGLQSQLNLQSLNTLRANTFEFRPVQIQTPTSARSDSSLVHSPLNTPVPTRVDNNQSYPLLNGQNVRSENDIVIPHLNLYGLSVKSDHSPLSMSQVSVGSQGSSNDPTLRDSLEESENRRMVLFDKMKEAHKTIQFQSDRLGSADEIITHLQEQLKHTAVLYQGMEQEMELVRREKKVGERKNKETIQSLLKRTRDLDQELQQLTSSHINLQAEHTRREAGLEQRLETLILLEEENKNLKKSGEIFKKECSNLRANLKESETLQEKFEEGMKLLTGDKEKLLQEHQSLLLQNNDLQYKLDEANKLCCEAKYKDQHHEQETIELKMEKDIAIGKCSVLEEELKHFQSSCDTLAVEKTELLEEKIQLEHQNKQLAIEMDFIKKTHQTLQEKCIHLSTEVQSLNNESIKFNKEKESLSETMFSLQHENESLSAELASVNESLRRRDDLMKSSTEKHQIMTQELEKLRKLQGNEKRGWIEEKTKLLQGLHASKHTANESQQLNRQLKQRVDSLLAQMSTVHVSGAFNQSKELNVLVKDNESLQNKLSVTQNSFNEMQEINSRLQEQLKNSSQRLEQERTKQKTDKQTQNSEKTQLQQELAQKQDELSHLTSELTQQKDSREKMREQVQNVLQQLHEQKSQLHKERKQWKEEKHKIYQAMKQHQERVAREKLESQETHTNEKTDLVKKCEKLEITMKEREDELLHCKENLHQSQNIVSLLRKDKEKLIIERKELSLNYKKAQRELTNLKESMKALSEEVHNKQQEIKTLKTQMDNKNAQNREKKDEKPSNDCFEESLQEFHKLTVELSKSKSDNLRLSLELDELTDKHNRLTLENSLVKCSLAEVEVEQETLKEEKEKMQQNYEILESKVTNIELAKKSLEKNRQKIQDINNKLEDEKIELENYVESLKRQLANKMELEDELMSLQSKLKMLKKNAQNHQENAVEVEVLQAELGKLRQHSKHYEEDKKELLSLKTELEEYKNIIRAHREQEQRMQELQSQLEKLQYEQGGEMHVMQERLEKLNRREFSHKEHENDLLMMQAETEAENKELKYHLEQLKKEKEDDKKAHNIEVENLRTTLEIEKRKEAKKSKDEMEQSVGNLSKELEEVKAELNTLLNALKSKDEELESSASKFDDLQNKVKQKLPKWKALNKDHTQLKKNYAELASKLSSRNQTVTILKEQLTDNAKDNSDMEVKLLTAQQKLEHFQHKYHLLAQEYSQQNEVASKWVNEEKFEMIAEQNKLKERITELEEQLKLWSGLEHYDVDEDEKAGPRKRASSDGFGQNGLDVNPAKMLNVCRQLRDENLALKERTQELKDQLKTMTSVHDAAQHDVNSLREGMKQLKEAFEEEIIRQLDVQKEEFDKKHKEKIHQDEGHAETEEELRFAVEACEHLQNDLEHVLAEREQLIVKCANLEHERNDLRDQIEELCQMGWDEHRHDSSPNTSGGSLSPSSSGSPTIKNTDKQLSPRQNNNKYSPRSSPRPRRSKSASAIIYEDPSEEFEEASNDFKNSPRGRIYSAS